jgi:hypothetical protein
MNSLYVRFGINPIHKIVTLTTGEYAYKEGINRLENMLIKKESIVRLSTSFSNWEKLYIRVTYIRALESAATITAQARINLPVCFTRRRRLLFLQLYSDSVVLGSPPPDYWFNFFFNIGKKIVVLFY